MEREFRREQAAGEAEALQLHRASRSMVVLAWEAMQRGDRIRTAWSGGEVSGIPTAAVGDLIVVRSPTHQIGVNVAVVITVAVLEDARGEGSSGDRRVGSFMAWTRMLEGQPVQVLTADGEKLDATLIATAADHLLVRTRSGTETAVATRAVAAMSVAGEVFFGL